MPCVMFHFALDISARTIKGIEGMLTCYPDGLREPLPGQHRSILSYLNDPRDHCGLSMHVGICQCVRTYTHTRMHACIKSMFATVKWASPASGGPGRTGEATAGVFWSESALQSVPLCDQSPAASCQGGGKGASQTDIEELGSGRFCTIISTQD